MPLISEGPDWATFTAGVKAMILQSSPSTRYVHRCPCWVQPWDKIFMLGDPLLILGETDKPWEWVQAVGKT